MLGKEGAIYHFYGALYTGEMCAGGALAGTLLENVVFGHDHIETGAGHVGALVGTTDFAARQNDPPLLHQAEDAIVDFFKKLV